MQHRWQGDRQGLEHRAEPGSKGGSYGSAARGTSCLAVSADAHGAVYEARLTLEDIEADAAQAVDVWVVDLGEEADLGGSHRVVVWQEKLKLEYAAWILSVRCTDPPHAPKIYPRRATGRGHRWSRRSIAGYHRGVSQRCLVLWWL